MSTELYSSSENVRVLRDAAHIRERPGLYIGDTRATGLHHLACELVYNAIDEFLAGRAKRVAVMLHADGSLSVADDGCGIAVDVVPEEGRPFLELVFTMVGVGAKFASGRPFVTAGLRGMGAKAVAALSVWTVADVRRGGRSYRQQYERGYAVTEVEDLGPADGTGTTVRFQPDPTIFTETRFDFGTLADRLRELAFLHPGLRIDLADERDGRRDLFHSPAGAADFVRWLAHDSGMWHEPITARATEGDLRIDAAIVWTESAGGVRGYANGGVNQQGGSHVRGLLAGQARVLPARVGATSVLAHDITPGLRAVVSVYLLSPHYEGCTKWRLLNPEIEAPISRAVETAVRAVFREHPAVAERVVARVAAEVDVRRRARTDRVAHHKKTR